MLTLYYYRLKDISRLISQTIQRTMTLFVLLCKLQATPWTWTLLTLLPLYPIPFILFLNPFTVVILDTHHLSTEVPLEQHYSKHFGLLLSTTHRIS